MREWEIIKRPVCGVGIELLGDEGAEKEENRIVSIKMTCMQLHEPGSMRGE